VSVTVRRPRVAPSVQPAQGDVAAAPAAPWVRLPIDPWLTLAVLGLGVCSVVTLNGAGAGEGLTASYFVTRQVAYLALGLIAMVVVSRFDYAPLKNAGRGIYIALLLSLLSVRALGSSSGGSVRSIQFPLFSFQASEIGKVLLVVALSSILIERYRQVRERRTTALVMLATLVAAMLVIIQPDVGSSLVYGVIGFAVLFVGGVPSKYLAGLLALVVLVAGVVVFAAPAAGIHVLQGYQEERLTAFLHPSSNPEKQGYQQQESKIAIGSGQKTGSKSAPQVALHFVPEAHTDFVFAAVGERYGFAGAAFVLSLYALLIWRILRILTMSKDLFGALLAGGVVAMVMFQVFINVGMAIGITPITGITLPLMSYGGSSVISFMLALGLVQAVYAQARSTQALKGRALALRRRV
jgi:rod shape determining protein RodA